MTSAASDPMASVGDGGSGRGVVRIASVAALGGLLFGYDSAVINGAVESIQDHFGVGDLYLGFAVASALLGAAAGAMLAGRIADRIGRLRVMKIAAVFFLVSAVGAGLGDLVVDNLWTLVFFRVVGGVGVGIASVIAPAYIAETSPARLRGRLGSLQQLAIVLGIFSSLLVDWLLAHFAGGASEDLWLGLEAWRWMFLSMVIPAVVYGVLANTIPESPRYLISQQRLPEARRVLETLLGERDLEITIERIQDSMDQEHRPSWRDMIRPAGGLYPIVWIGLALSVFQQAVGINVIFYYSNILWQAAGFDESQSFMISVITSVINVLTTIVAIALVDKIGRRPLLLIGSGGMAVTLGAMAACFATADVVDGNPELGAIAGPVALVAANLFVIFFGMSWGPVVWVLLGEMFPNRFRAAALSLAAAGQWATNWLVTISFPGLKSFNLGFAYGLYTIFAVLSLLFVAKFVQETKGKTLEDMDEMAGIRDA